MKLIAENLTKEYRKGKKALDDFSYTFHEGIYGLLGPNGAGKSTLMGIITTGFPPTSGRLLYDGTEIRSMGKAYRRHIGYMPQPQKLYEDFTLVRFLYYIASLKGLKRDEAATQIDGIIRDVNLWDVRGDAIGTYSGGMRQRALLAQTLVGNPDILILDEPTVGLDPKERVNFRELVSRVAQDKTVIIATHIVSDLEKLASEIIFLNLGRIVKSGTLQELYEDFDGDGEPSVEKIYMSLGMESR
ncbi:MAG: ATP-binding cassette domain-containing protein [Lachnospiraceae bacterium]|nr:ATP-binding cassette domain-containing protein [Lachnospiraceae bacterium]